MTGESAITGWFHGGPRIDGDVILPRNTTAAPRSTTGGRPDRVYVTRLIWFAAQCACRHSDPFVYEVNPLGPIEDDPHHTGRLDVAPSDLSDLASIAARTDFRRESGDSAMTTSARIVRRDRVPQWMVERCTEIRRAEYAVWSGWDLETWAKRHEELTGASFRTVVADGGVGPASDGPHERRIGALDRALGARATRPGALDRVLSARVTRPIVNPHERALRAPDRSLGGRRSTPPMVTVFVDYDGVVKSGADANDGGSLIDREVISRLAALPAELRWLSMRAERTRARALPGVPAAATVDDYPRSTWYATDGSWWKLKAMRAIVGTAEPFVWIDDELAHVPAAHEWANTREAPSLLIAPDASVGLTPEHLDRIDTFVATAQSL